VERLFLERELEMQVLIFVECGFEDENLVMRRCYGRDCMER
jgi:hypothetical protein